MKKVAYAIAAVAALATASVGNAATTVTSNSGLTLPAPTVSVNGDVTTINFGQGTIQTPTFNYMFSFMTDDTPYSANFVVGSSTTGVDFTTANVSGPNLGATGMDLSVLNAMNPASLFLNDVPLLANTVYTVTLAGNAPNPGAFTGNATLTVPAVPEPATWAMMLIGFGAMGFAVRRRSRPVLAQLA